MKHVLTIIFLTGIILHLSGQTLSPAEAFMNNDLLKNANISLLVCDLTTGEVIAQHRPENSQIPASTIKLITTATALELLGPDFRFETKLQVSGEIDADGTLNGNLYIYGGGDPTLGSEYLPNRNFLNLWLRAVNKAGIKNINGSIIADASIFDDEGINPKWLWEDIGNYYAPAIYGISYMDNVVRVHLYSGEIGSTPAVIKTTPHIPGLTFNNNLRSTIIQKDSAYFYGVPLSNVRTIYGEIPANRPNYVTKTDMPNPALLLAQHFHELLIESGIKIAYPPADQYRSSSEERKTIHTHYSLPLSRIIKEINFVSNNHYAEHVFRYLGLQKSSVAKTSNSISVIRDYWKSKGLPVEQLFMYDGSGLARSNGVSAQFYVKMLTYMKLKSPYSNDFYESLPVAGQSGTLSYILRNTPLEGNLKAKSGSISLVRGYAGYIDVNDKNYVFAVIVNNYNGRPRHVVREIENFLLSVVR